MRDFPRHAHLADVLEDEILPHAMPCTPPELVDEPRPVLSAAFQELMDRLVHLHMKERACESYRIIRRCTEIATLRIRC